MSFIDFNKLADQAAERIVLKVSQNLTLQADEFVVEIKQEFTKSLDTAANQIVNGFEQISAQLEEQMKTVYVILGLQVFIFMCCGYAGVVYLINVMRTPPKVYRPSESQPEILRR